jgi:hypothetical protein
MIPANAKEEAALNMMRINTALGIEEVKRELILCGWKIQYSRRSSRNLWGRFGGGWNWKVGIQIGGSSAIINLLVFEIRISKGRKCHYQS